MKKLIPLFLILCSFFIYGQRPQGTSELVKITGTVLDKEYNEPMEYATLILQSVNNPDKVTGGITDINGKFSVEAEPGMYNIRLEYISYTTFRLDNQNITSSRDLGTVMLGINVEQLEAVEVVGEKTTVEVRLDKKIYNIGKDITTSGATVSDALNNVPSVSVDVEGAISLRGNENVRILINGRPSALAGFGSTDALRQLPADAIDRVEVITSPSARYDAEGTAGILNIILKKEKTLGFNGSINTNIGYPAASQISSNLNLRTDKFNIFNTLGLSYRRPPGGGFSDNTYRQRENDTIAPKFNRIIEDRNILREDLGFNMNIGIEYFITDRSSLTASYFARISDESDVTENDSRRFEGTTITSRTFRSEDESQKDKSNQVALNYINRLDDDGQKLTADLQYSFDTEDIFTVIQENNTFPNNDLLALENVNEKENQKEFLFQTDYVLPMGDAQFEVGYRGNFEETISDYQLDLLNLDTNVFERNELTNVFTYNENVNALYTQYGDKFGKFSFLAGLRLENTQLKGQVDTRLDPQELREVLGPDIDVNFNKNYLGLFPTLNLIFEIAERENITLGYNRRINRPRGWYINPFPSRSSRTNIFQGNPDLDPAYANAFDLGYLKRWDKLTLTSSIYYQKETNSFERVQVQRSNDLTEDGVGIIRTIPINLSTNERIGAEAGALYNPNKWLRLNGSFNFFQFATEGSFEGESYGATNTSWFARFSSKVNLPAKIEWQTNAFYSGPSENAQTKNEGIFSLNLAISKDIMGDQGTLAFNVSDLLNSRKRISFTETPNFTSDSEFQWRQRQFNLSFVYRFNQPKGKQNGRRNGGPEDEERDFGGGA
jgi:hypothetical protein